MQPPRVQSSTTIAIELNGERRELAEQTTVADLIRDLGLREGMVAVEVNEKVIPRGSRQETRLRAGDRVELVTMMGGG